MSIYSGGFNDVNPNSYPALAYAEAQATANDTLTATSDTLINNMTLTPLAGTYLVWFSSSHTNDSNGDDTYYSIYAGGAQIVPSERIARSFINGVVIGNQPNGTTMATQCLVTVDGTQAIEVKARVTGGTTTIYQRTMNILKVADV